MVENWDDDERSVCKMPYSYKEHCSSDDEYVPVTSIVRDYFREEKERLYTYSTKDDVTWDDDNIYIEPYSEDSFYEDGNDNTEDGDNTDDCESDYLSGEKEKKKKSITDIIDDDVYKKFSYL